MLSTFIDFFSISKPQSFIGPSFGVNPKSGIKKSTSNVMFSEFSILISTLFNLSSPIRETTSAGVIRLILFLFFSS